MFRKCSLRLGESSYANRGYSNMIVNDSMAAHSVAMRTALKSLLLLTVATAPAWAQGRWKEIGKTSVGNLVYVDPGSVKTVSGVITARIRVKFIEPVKTPRRSLGRVAPHRDVRLRPLDRRGKGKHLLLE